MLDSATLQQPAAVLAAAAPAEHAALSSAPAAGLQQLLPAAPALAHISPMQLVGPAAAAAEELPTGPGPAAEDDDNGALTFVGLVFAVVAFTSLHGSSNSSSSSSSSSAIDRDAMERPDRFPWSGFNRFGDDFDWIDDD
jgi:hypothetical protein